MDEGSPSFLNCLCSAGPVKPGAQCAPSLPPHNQLVCALSRHLGMPGPGGQGQTFPSLSLKAQGFPQGMVIATVRGRGEKHLAQCDLCPTRAGQSTSGPVVPAAPATSITHLFTLQTAGASREIT